MIEVRLIPGFALSLHLVAIIILLAGIQCSISGLALTLWAADERQEDPTDAQ